MKLLKDLLSRWWRLLITIEPMDEIPTYCELIARERLRQLRRGVHDLETILDEEEALRAKRANMTREKRTQFGTNYASTLPVRD